MVEAYYRCVSCGEAQETKYIKKDKCPWCLKNNKPRLYEYYTKAYLDLEEIKKEIWPDYMDLDYDFQLHLYNQSKEVETADLHAFVKGYMLCYKKLKELRLS
ncbi:hypothetical protein LCGC14_0175450 [marine sediment metagenome]|uniref:Uncharacterized protein n=1 Tax=marine sediment metagenome TaxID=412755 RepID=A0A0F9X9L2_9ZZZZ